MATKATRGNPLPWAYEVDAATRICASLGCTVERSSHAYEVAKIKGDGVSLILYPHRTGTGARHIRVRDNGSRDQVRSADVMNALDQGRGLPQSESDRIHFSCTFTRKMSLRRMFTEDRINHD